MTSPDTTPETTPELVRVLVALYADADRGGDTPDPQDWYTVAVLAESDIHELDLARLEAERLARAARQARELIETWIARDIQANGPIRLGDDGWYVGPASETTVSDPEGLAAWVLNNGGPKMIAKAFRLEPRLRVIQGLAAEYGMEQTVMDTFFTKTTDLEPKLRKSRAKWVEKLAHGQRRPR